ncbi:peptidylprolyl isomerase [Bacillus sp. FJAT-50079]|uniref:peptidylprolyl isomerase n=1 Tax=Bacillus sp. FJAT-50079 TaxID=2833577 RepID=UPI001BC96D40|nr:peptidylprolyl isomerase [Bacillus sp. FJAT-50079]MBS4210213.1 peptidylprolyl isomerase [Bacillus sp. FJAT-50079]
MGNKKFLFSTIILIVVGLAVIFGAAFTQREIVANVDGEKITKNELYDVLVEHYGTDTLDTMITDKIVELEAKKEKISISNKEIDDELADYKEAYGGEEAFNSLLEQSGIDEKQVQDDIKQYITLKKLIEPRINITDEEMKEYFEENKDQFDEKEQVQASHILVEDEKTAKEVKEKLDAGEDFAELAAEYSTDTSNAESSGELGYFSRGEMVEEFDEVAFAMKKDEISDPVKTEHGYHIIKVTDRKEAKEAAYEDHKDEVKETLFNEKLQTEYPTWLDEKKSEYKIKNSLS